MLALIDLTWELNWKLGRTHLIPIFCMNKLFNILRLEGTMLAYLINHRFPRWGCALLVSLCICMRAMYLCMHPSIIRLKAEIGKNFCSWLVPFAYTSSWLSRIGRRKHWHFLYSLHYRSSHEPSFVYASACMCTLCIYLCLSRQHAHVHLFRMYVHFSIIFIYEEPFC